MKIIKSSVPQDFAAFRNELRESAIIAPIPADATKYLLLPSKSNSLVPLVKLEPTWRTATPHVDLELPHVMPEYRQDPGALDAMRAHSSLAWYRARGGQISHWHQGIERACVVACGREPPRPCTLKWRRSASYIGAYRPSGGGCARIQAGQVDRAERSPGIGRAVRVGSVGR